MNPLKTLKRLARLIVLVAIAGSAFLFGQVYGHEEQDWQEGVVMRYGQEDIVDETRMVSPEGSFVIHGHAVDADIGLELYNLFLLGLQEGEFEPTVQECFIGDLRLTLTGPFSADAFNEMAEYFFAFAPKEETMKHSAGTICYGAF